MDANESLSTVSHLFKEKHIRHLPVVLGGKLVGIITDRDIKRASASDATLLEVHELLYVLNKIKASEVMTENPITVSPGSDLKAAAGLLVQNKIGGLPVLEGNKLVGIITDTDILAHLANS